MGLKFVDDETFEKLEPRGAAVVNDGAKDFPAEFHKCAKSGDVSLAFTSAAPHPTDKLVTISLKDETNSKYKGTICGKTGVFKPA